MKLKIKKVKAREILDSRGNPTVEADCLLADGSFGRRAQGMADEGVCRKVLCLFQSKAVPAIASVRRSIYGRI